MFLVFSSRGESNLYRRHLRERLNIEWLIIADCRFNVLLILVNEGLLPWKWKWVKTAGKFGFSVRHLITPCLAVRWGHPSPLGWQSLSSNRFLCPSQPKVIKPLLAKGSDRFGERNLWTRLLVKYNVLNEYIYIIQCLCLW